MQQINNMAGPHNGGIAAPPSDFCKHACYNDAMCSVWQFSSAMGCWIGTASEASCQIQAPADMLGGERVFRACGSEAIRRTQTDFFKVFGIIGLVAVILTFCSLIILLSQAWSAQKKNTRSGEQAESPDSDEDESLGTLISRRENNESSGRPSPDQGLTPVPETQLMPQAAAQPSQGVRSQGPPSSAGSFQSWTPYQSNPGPSPPSFTASSAAGSFVQPGPSPPSFTSSAGSSFAQTGQPQPGIHRNRR
jgi:hypothetical protein